MKKNETLTIIDENFTSDEAKDVIMNLFSSKLNYHQIKNWSSQEKFGKNDVIAQEKIPALKNEMKRFEEILLEAKANNKKLVISSEINIELLENTDSCLKVEKVL
jgi:hypothetical protein